MKQLTAIDTPSTRHKLLDHIVEKDSKFNVLIVRFRNHRFEDIQKGLFDRGMFTISIQKDQAYQLLVPSEYHDDSILFHVGETPVGIGSLIQVYLHLQTENSRNDFEIEVELDYDADKSSEMESYVLKTLKRRMSPSVARKEVKCQMRRVLLTQLWSEKRRTEDRIFFRDISPNNRVANMDQSGVINVHDSLHTMAIHAKVDSYVHGDAVIEFFHRLEGLALVQKRKEHYFTFDKNKHMLRPHHFKIPWHYHIGPGMTFSLELFKTFRFPVTLVIEGFLDEPL